ncbi:MAG: hypothetical protein SGARI_000002 [Bacillariaceae sp.]
MSQKLGVGSGPSSERFKVKPTHTHHRTKKLRVLSSNDILREGLKLAHVTVERQANACRATNVVRFRAEYGADPAVYAQLFTDLQTTSNAEAKIDGQAVCLPGYFMALNFLKRYATEEEQANGFDMTRTTIRKWRWYFVSRIRALVKEKIRWPEEWKGEDDIPPGFIVPTLLLTVDGVHFRINEPTHPDYNKNTKFYSHKFKTSALNYEIGIHLFESRVVHFRGPYRAALHDITIFREELVDKIPDGHFCIGDKGYIGEPEKVMGPNSHDTPEVRQFKGRARARHESFNKRIKFYKCMDSERFRHGIEAHEMCFEAVVVLCQYQMEMGEPLFDPRKRGTFLASNNLIARAQVNVDLLIAQIDFNADESLLPALNQDLAHAQTVLARLTALSMDMMLKIAILECFDGFANRKFFDDDDDDDEPDMNGKPTTMGSGTKTEEA